MRDVLAASGGSALVRVMVSDQWDSAKADWARLFERTHAGASERLERSRALLLGLSGRDRERAAAQQASEWSVRLEDLLEDHPDLAERLRVMVEQVRTSADQAGASQRVTASGYAQQAVQGAGVQVNTFGGNRPEGEG